ncbi:MAG: hypothetical protein ACE5F6_19395 [Anaerolineae bacterium]
MGAKLDPAFEKRLRSDPTGRFDIIVRTAGDPRDRVAQAAVYGLSIRHTYRLINALAATGLGASVLQLADESWVENIEPDEEVRTMD